MSLSSQAASNCKQFAFIYQTSFIQGDGEGMQSHNCKETNFNVGDNLYSKMQSLTSAGKQDQALKELDRVLAINNNAVDDKSYQANAEICVRPSQKKSFEQLMQQIGKQKAAALERTSKHHEAINTDIDFCLGNFSFWEVES